MAETPTSAFIGLQNGRLRFTALDEYPSLIEPDVHRPLEQKWLTLRPLAQTMAQPDQSSS